MEKRWLIEKRWPDEFDEIVDKAYRARKATIKYRVGDIGRENLENELKDISLEELIKAEKIGQEYEYKHRFGSTITRYYFYMIYKKQYPWALRARELHNLVIGILKKENLKTPYELTTAAFFHRGMYSRHRKRFPTYNRWSHYTAGILGSGVQPKGARIKRSLDIHTNFGRIARPVDESEVDSILRVLLEANDLKPEKIEQYVTFYKKFKKPVPYSTLARNGIFVYQRKDNILIKKDEKRKRCHALTRAAREAIELLLDKDVQEKWEEFKKLKTSDRKRIWIPLLTK